MWNNKQSKAQKNCEPIFRPISSYREWNSILSQSVAKWVQYRTRGETSSVPSISKKIKQWY